MPIRKLIRIAVLGGACVLPAACATTSYSRSGVAAMPPGVKGKAGSNATVEIEGLRLRLESLDYAKRLDPVTLPLARRAGRSLDRVYWLEVLLAPLALAGGGL